MRIVAIDFETANSSMASACSLGLAIYEDGELIDNFAWPLKPQNRYFFFTNTWVHGITKEDVINEKEFYEYYDKLKEIIDGAILVAHNASFDMTVLNSVCDIYGLDHFTNEYLDTVKISRRVYPELINHKLDTVSNYLCIELDHHKACSDALACLLILLKAMEAYDTEDLDVFLNKISYRPNKNR